MILKKVFDYFYTYPKNLFIIDAYGALLSAFLLGIVLIQFESFFGIPHQTLSTLAIIPCFFAGYDVLCYSILDKKIGFFLKVIAYGNFLYSGISIGFAFYHYHEITIWGWIYILSEIFIITILGTIEIRAANSYNRKFPYTETNLKNKMNSTEIRLKFKEFAGDEKHLHFILTLYEAFPLKDKLEFWQEQLLNEFSDQFNLNKFDIKLVYQIFNHCPIHDDYILKKEQVRVVDGNSISYSHKREKEFHPMANTNAPRDLERFQYPPQIEILYCSKCRQCKYL